MRIIFNKRFLVILSAVLVVLVFIIILLPSETRIKIIPSSPISPSPTSGNEATPTSTPENRRPLTIISSTVPDRLLGLQEGFIITFSQTPSASELFYEITPDELITMSLKDKSVYISPYPRWKTNTQYKIVIKSTTKDIYGNLLNKNYEYNFKTVNVQEIY